MSVHAAADALGLHTRVTTATRAIGAAGGDPVKAYLDIDALIDAARASGCDCVHPGYGFLSENAAFARRCAGGRPGVRRAAARDPGAVRRQGEGARARGGAGRPGRARAATRRWRARRRRRRRREALGYPVMLKAAAGGGGRGMRRVDGPEEMAAAFARCRSEAEAAFGDDAVFVEKLIARPRHIEVQMLADQAGRHRPPLRARLLGAAAQPEGGRDRPGAESRAGPARSASWPTR